MGHPMTAAVMFVAFAAAPSAAQPLIQVLPVETHRIESKAVGDSFAVRVMLPPLIPEEHARFPSCISPMRLEDFRSGMTCCA
jgi:hypothetical protein